MSNDVILITIDCWRYDALERMGRLRSLTGEFGRAEAICQAPATRGAFPAILSSRYYPQAYAGFDTVREDVRPLPALLSERGYATGAVVGSNPFLSAWQSYFDHFWNDRMDAASDEGMAGTVRAGLSAARHAYNYLRLRSRVTATDVAERARAWYEAQAAPRFLWMHLMDAHAPFFPGLRKGLEEGLVDAYLSHLRFMRDPEATSAGDRRTLENLYWRSIERLDEQMRRVLEFVEDGAAVVLLGDHGEEFDHGKYGHARLYDECVRVPLLFSPSLADAFGDGSPFRQLDVPATVLDALGYDAPGDWEGAPGRTLDRPTAYMLNHSPQFERTYAGVRTGRYKLMKTFDAATGRQLRTEAYDLVADSGERTDIYDRTDDELSRLERQLDAFRTRDDIRSGILEHDREDAASAVVEDRLKALGYT